MIVQVWLGINILNFRFIPGTKQANKSFRKFNHYTLLFQQFHDFERREILLAPRVWTMWPDNL